MGKLRAIWLLTDHSRLQPFHAGHKGKGRHEYMRYLLYGTGPYTIGGALSMDRRNTLFVLQLIVLQFVSALWGLRLLAVLLPQLLSAEPLNADAENCAEPDNAYLFKFTAGQLTPLLLLLLLFSPSQPSLASPDLWRAQNPFDLRLDAHRSLQSHALGSVAPNKNDFRFILSFLSWANGCGR